jgi:signal transduction histidine kinase
MTRTLIAGRVSFAVAWRLAAGVLPSVLTVALVIGLFYYGEIGREAPRIVLVAASALTLTSLVIAWANSRYFANRIARLARVTDHASGGTGHTDEFERVEQIVGNLGSALSAAEAERAKSEALATAKLHDESTMLAGVVSDSLAQLDDVRLPLHILLESRFGELNENQEELLRDARNAADSIDVALRRLGQLADADRGATLVQRELVQINDVVRSVLPLARAAADRQSARVEVALEPGLPRALADRARLAEALALLVADATTATGPKVPLTVSTERSGAAAIIHISPTGSGAASDRTRILASRAVAAQGGELSVEAAGLVLRIGG